MKQPGKAVVWPANIDSTKSARQGRRIRKDFCVNSPKLQEMNAAAERLRLSFEVIRGSSRPSSWWDKTGHLIVETSGTSKRDILLNVAKEIKHTRAGNPRRSRGELAQLILF